MSQSNYPPRDPSNGADPLGTAGAVNDPGAGLAAGVEGQGSVPQGTSLQGGQHGAAEGASGTAVPSYNGHSGPTGVGAGDERRVTRAGMVWAAVATALVVLVLLIVFILQNQDMVRVRFFGLEGAVALGVALFIAAVGGGVLVAMAGAARIIQLRAAARRVREKARR